MKRADLKQFNLPDAPGVYFFKKGKNILYVGKATSLKDRVKSYFARDLFVTRGPLIVKMLSEIDRVEFIQTDSVLEALILEANEIKKHQPFYNSKEKDDKSYNYVVVTKEDFPRILLMRGRELLKIENCKLKIAKRFGPFPHSGELREALKIIRKIFPFRDAKCRITPKLKPCFNAQIGLCPGPCGSWINQRDYRKIVKHITLFFEAKKTELIISLEKEMKSLAKDENFEQADRIKQKIYALNHIQDIALIKRDVEANEAAKLGSFRIEAYDIAHISGTNVVGVMTVVEDGEVNKSHYRKFKIRADKNDDTRNLKEVITRRLNHPEWPMPDLIVVDGGVAQLNVAKSLTKIPIVAVTKDERHKAKEIIGQDTRDKKQGTNNRAILLANAEAHRFAINYHRLLRNKGFRI